MRAPSLHRARVLLVAALALAFVGAAAPAQAEAGVAANIRAVGGDHVVTATWPRVTGATGYRVRVTGDGTTRSFTTARRTVRVHGLANGARYAVAVLPVSTGITADALRQQVAHATTSAAMPTPITGIRAVAGPLPDQVTVSWHGGGDTAKVAVVAGSDVLTLQRQFDSGWYPATTRSITLTVPPRYRAFVGAGTGNPVFVKVLQSNSGSTAMSRSYSYADRLRPSPIGTWAFAKAEEPVVPVTKLRVAEMNIQSVQSTVGFQPVDQWAQRVSRVAAAIQDPRASPDLLLTAELSTNLTSPCQNHHVAPYQCRTHTQVADLARRLTTLKLADTDAYDRVLDEMRTFPQWDGRATDGAHVFYDPAKLQLLAHGFFSPALPAGSYFGGKVQGLGVPNWTGTNAIGPDRWVSWAKFRTMAGGRVFYAVAAHLPVGAAGVVVTARQQEAQRLVRAIDAMAGTTPVVFGSDMNADAVRDPRPAHTVFMQDGWFDAGAVAAKHLRVGMRVSTANGSGPQDGVDDGYGDRPNVHPYQTSRIDYILLKNSPYTYRYANVLRVNADGTFDKAEQGTDHNMQLATIGIAGPTTS